MEEQVKKIGRYLNKLANGASHYKTIEIYTIKNNINTPLAGSPNEIANCGIGDYVLIIDEEVWIRNWNEEFKDEFVRAIYSAEFVRINTAIFDKQR